MMTMCFLIGNILFLNLYFNRVSWPKTLFIWFLNQLQSCISILFVMRLKQNSLIINRDDNNAHKDICTKRTKLIQGWRSTDRTVLGCIHEIRSFVLGNSE